MNEIIKFCYDVFANNFLSNIILAIIIVFLANSLGKLLIKNITDYQPITSLFNAENSIGFNAIYRILIAPISIIMFSIIFYVFKMDSNINNIWAISVWFLIIQLILIVLVGRWRLVNKSKYFVFHIISIALSYYLYSAAISKGLNHLLPDEANLRTEMWLIIAVFFYGIFKNIRENDKSFQNRKDQYITKKAIKFRKKYGFITNKCNPMLRDIILAIMIYENYNRPRIARVFEWAIQSKTRGIMQVNGAKNDESSIVQTIKLIRPYYKEFKAKTYNEIWEQENALRSLFEIHNPGSWEYSSRVLDIFKIIHK